MVGIRGDDATGSPASVFFSIPFSPPWPTLAVCKGFTLLTFVGTEWLEDWREMQRRALDGEMWQLEGNVEEFDPWDLFPRPQYSQSWCRNSLVLQISRSSSYMDHNRASHWDIQRVWNRLPNAPYQVASHCVVTSYPSTAVEASWNVMAHEQKPDFVFRRNGRVHLNRRGRQFSRLLAAEVCASAIVMLDTPCSEVVWRVLATHSIRQFPLHFSSRASLCAIIFQLDTNIKCKQLSYAWGRRRRRQVDDVNWLLPYLLSLYVEFTESTTVSLITSHVRR
jgi:hypothetical protein